MTATEDIHICDVSMTSQSNEVQTGAPGDMKTLPQAFTLHIDAAACGEIPYAQFIAELEVSGYPLVCTRSSVAVVVQIQDGPVLFAAPLESELFSPHKMSPLVATSFYNFSVSEDANIPLARRLTASMHPHHPATRILASHFDAMPIGPKIGRMPDFYGNHAPFQMPWSTIPLPATSWPSGGRMTNIVSDHLAPVLLLHVTDISLEPYERPVDVH